jgi:hypothetical protein
VAHAGGRGQRGAEDGGGLSASRPDPDPWDQDLVITLWLELAALTILLLILGRELRAIPGAVVAFAAAGYVLRMPDRSGR